MHEQEWYRSLDKPHWAPKEKTFRVVWSLLYPIIFGVNVYIFILLIQREISWLAALPFWINLLFNAAFSPIQFILRNLKLAAADALLLLLTTIWCMVAVWRTVPIVSLLFIPYAVWVGLAVVLQFSIMQRNRHRDHKLF